MNDTLARFIAHAEYNAQGLAELVWDAAHQACARLTHDLPETIAHELSELHLEETLKLLRSDAREQVRYLVKTLGEAEAARRLTLALEPPACVAA
ncbi:hypothetical protein [Thiofaba sp. EF100]|jgi:hypothetical protein|uniref:hypothetical protein n=1 Tax=Thiofaba sp. EF100 TaxID=3121274 RepID=UPI003221DAF3